MKATSNIPNLIKESQLTPREWVAACALVDISKPTADKMADGFVLLRMTTLLKVAEIFKSKTIDELVSIEA